MMTDNPYSASKVYWHRATLDAIARGDTPPPTHIQLIISDLCNQDCGFCAYRMTGYTTNELFGVVRPDGTVNHNPNRMIPFEKVIEILDDAAAMGVKAIQLTGGGEPTVHPHFADILDACYRRNLEVAVVTNGVNLTTNTIHLLMKATWVRVSVDAGRAETYTAIRRVPKHHFQKALSNLAGLCQAKRTSGSHVTIGAGFVVTKENWEEVVEFTRIAKEAGADNVRISAVFQSKDADYFEQFYALACEACREAEAYTSASFQVVNMFGNRVDDLIQRQPAYSFCGYQQFATYIGADLNVYRCCVLAYSTRGIIGSLADQRFRTLWEQDAPQAFHGFQATGCPRCQFNNKNKEIRQALTPPPHVNFV